MDKRYQVFISSTFLDLQQERLKVQQAVMELECIPAGMEAFPAIDEEQFAFIKKVIDDCDYYLLIIGGRYGSVSEEGLSYTEMEYDYAVSKGIKVIIFLHKDPSSLPANKTDQSDKLKKKLLAFRKKVSKGRLIRFWNNADELQGLVSTSLSKTMRAYPAVGWVRGDSVPSSEVYKELNDLRKENSELKTIISQNESLEQGYNIAGLSDSVLVEGWLINPSSGITEEWSIDTTWGYMFNKIATGIQIAVTEDSIVKYLSIHFYKKSTGKEVKNGLELKSPNKMGLRLQFRALNLINISSQGDIILWKLTSAGERLMLINSAKKKSN